MVCCCVCDLIGSGGDEIRCSDEGTTVALSVLFPILRGHSVRPLIRDPSFILSRIGLAPRLSGKEVFIQSYFPKTIVETFMAKSLVTRIKQQ